MKRLKEFYSSLPKKSFISLAILAFMMCDVAVLSYLYFKFSDYELFKTSLTISFSATGTQGDPELVSNLYQMYHRTLIMVLGIAASFHLAMYFFIHKEKEFALGYKKFLIKIGAPLLILWGITLIIASSLWGIGFIILGLGVFSLRLGLKKTPGQ